MKLCNRHDVPFVPRGAGHEPGGGHAGGRRRGDDLPDADEADPRGQHPRPLCDRRARSGQRLADPRLGGHGLPLRSRSLEPDGLHASAATSRPTRAGRTRSSTASRSTTSGASSWSCPTATMVETGGVDRGQSGLRSDRPDRRQRGDLRHRDPGDRRPDAATRRRAGRCWASSTRWTTATETVSGIIAAGIVPAALEMLDNLMIQAVEQAFHFGFPDRRRGGADHRGRRPRRRARPRGAGHLRDRPVARGDRRRSRSPGGPARSRSTSRSGRAASRPSARSAGSARRSAPRTASSRGPSCPTFSVTSRGSASGTGSASPTSSMPATATSTRSSCSTSATRTRSRGSCRRATRSSRSASPWAAA